MSHQTPLSTSFQNIRSRQKILYNLQNRAILGINTTPRLHAIQFFIFIYFENSLQ